MSVRSAAQRRTSKAFDSQRQELETVLEIFYSRFEKLKIGILFPRLLLKASVHNVQAAFLRVCGDTARKPSRFSARVQCVSGFAEREETAAVV